MSSTAHWKWERKRRNYNIVLPPCMKLEEWWRVYNVAVDRLYVGLIFYVPERMPLLEVTVAWTSIGPPFG